MAGKYALKGKKMFQTYCKAGVIALQNIDTVANLQKTFVVVVHALF